MQATELQLLEKAKTYIDKMANGINPITDEPVSEEDIINNVRISRCLFYVSDVLEKEIKNCKKEFKKEIKTLTIENAEKEYEKLGEKVFVSAIASKLNEVFQFGKNTIKPTMISNWLLSIGAMETIEDTDNKRRIPTEEGKIIGLSLEKRNRNGSDYFAVLYNRSAQKFIYDNIDFITGTRKFEWNETNLSLLKKMVDSKASVNEMAITLKCSREMILEKIKPIG